MPASSDGGVVRRRPHLSAVEHDDFSPRASSRHTLTLAHEARLLSSLSWSSRVVLVVYVQQYALLLLLRRLLLLLSSLWWWCCL